MKRLSMNLLRLLIGIGFTFSLALSVTFTLLTLCDGTGDNLTLSRTEPHWEWLGGAIPSWLFLLFCWVCWRLLPAEKPIRMFPIMERGLESPIVTVVIALVCPLGLAAAVSHQILHRQAHDWLAIFLYGVGTIGAWSQAAQAWKHRRR